MGSNPLGDWDVEIQRDSEVTAVQRRYLEELDPRAMAEAMLGREPLVDTPGRGRMRNLLDLMRHDVPVGDLRRRPKRRDRP